MKLVRWVVVLLCLPTLAQAAGAGDIAEVSLDDLLAVEVTSTSKVARSLRDAPGVVTLVSRDDIQISGARDLMDVLRLVPGFEFGVDVQGVVGLGFRGVWGHEGKILLLVDGLEMNERSYGTLQLGNHFNVDSIERVEVIRGPGSVIHGGVAELAVINVITRRAKDLHGTTATARYGQMERTYGRRTLAISSGHVLDAERNITVDAHLFFGQGNRSDQVYTDIFGDSYRMTNSQAIAPAQVNVSATAQDLTLRFFYDRYTSTSRDGYDEVLPEAFTYRFVSYKADARYDWHLLENLTVTPYLTFSQQDPWNATDAATVGTLFYYDTTISRYKGGVGAVWQALNWLNVSVGVEAYRDTAVNNISAQQEGSAAQVTFSDVAGYAEGLARTPYVDVSLGARYEYHSQFGGSFVPRLALTKTWDALHVKALASQAFRAPSFENLISQPDIQPERTTAFELEAGYKLTQSLFVVANVFDTTVKRPIVYFYDEATDTEGYLNGRRLGTSGGELVVQYKKGKGQVGLSYAYYVPRAFLFGAPKNGGADYAVATDNSALVGFAPHKAAAALRYEVAPNVKASLTANFLSGRYAYTSLDSDATPVIKKLAPIALVDVFLSYDNLGFPGLSAGLGVFNLLHNRSQVYIQPYNSYHAPLPMGSREVVARLQYSVDFL